MHSDLATMCVSPGASIHEAIAQIEVERAGIVLVVDSERRLLGTITDGDVRRALLANIDLNEQVSSLLAFKADSPFAQPITAPVETDRNALLVILQQHGIQHLPLVDQESHVVGLVRLDEFLPKQEAPTQAVIMAGGMGVRLRPLTDDLPKPMLPLGGRPLMEIILEQLRDVGIQQVNITLHHKSEKVTEYFGDGRNFGIKINYVTEERPLGTAGALGLMDPPKDTVLVINGDILTHLDFHAMLAYHREHGAELTLAVQQYNLQLPYGVVECEGTSVKSFTEKPAKNFLVNAGIYLLEPEIYGFIPNGQAYDMTDLIQRLLHEGLLVVAFPLREYWIDIGVLSDYEKAQRDMETDIAR